MSYTILALKKHNITLDFDGDKINFVLPLVDGKYPEGDALFRMLDSYEAGYRARISVENTVASNDSAVRSLISPTSTHLAASAKASRNLFLRLTDWTQIAEHLSLDVRAQWSEYRAALRVLPEQEKFPTIIIWPVPPSPIVNLQGIVITNNDGSPVVF